MKSAAQSTMPQACKRDGVHSRKHQPWFDSSCREALGLKDAVYKNPHSNAAEKVVAEKKFRFVTDRVKETWTRKRNAELCELSAKDPSQFWKAFKAPQSNACPVELSAQFEAFRALMEPSPSRQVDPHEPLPSPPPPHSYPEDGLLPVKGRPPPGRERAWLGCAHQLVARIWLELIYDSNPSNCSTDCWPLLQCMSSPGLTPK